MDLTIVHLLAFSGDLDRLVQELPRRQWIIDRGIDPVRMLAAASVPSAMPAEGQMPAE